LRNNARNGSDEDAAVSINVARVKIKNILGIEEFELSPGKFTAITGRNGAGKTSILEAVKSALRGGHDATLLRNGADRGEVVLVLDDGTEIAKRVTASGSTQAVRDANGGKVARPADAIRALIDALSVNPIEFLAVPKKQQISALLEAMPMRADVARLAEITGRQIAGELAEAHALDAIDTVYKLVYDDRTGLNRAAKEKAGTISQLEATIPAALADCDAVDETALESAMEAADAARDAELARIDGKLAGMETGWSATLDDLQVQIDTLQAKIAATKAEREETRARAEKQRQITRDKCAAEKQGPQEQLALIRANRDAAAKARATRETIDKMAEELDGLKGEAEAATAALAALDAYKAELLAGLPIPGLEVRDGEIYFNGVLFDRLNSAEQVKVAVEVAKLRAGKLGLVCVDGIERLDPAAFEAFREQAVASDVQLVVTRVGDGDLAVEVAP